MDLTHDATIHTDGSYYNGVGGWAWILSDGEKQIEGWGQEHRTTSNKMELVAVINALRYAIKHNYHNLILYSDSQYLIRTMLGEYKRRKNKDLWQKLDQLSADLNVHWNWIPGHNGTPLNERADQLAQAARRL